MTPLGIEILSVRNRRDLRRFLSLPLLIYRADPLYVRPIGRQQLRFWSPAHNPALKGRHFELFIALQVNKCVGRIAAFSDPDFSEKWDEKAGFFGFMECIDDQAVANGLFRAAESRLLKWGLSRCYGPVNLSTQYEVGLMTRAVDQAPMLLSPYNPIRYNEQVEAAGYQIAREYLNYESTLTGEARPVVHRALRLAEARSNARIRIRSADLSQWDDEINLIWQIYNRSFEEVWGFTPIGLEEFSSLADQFRGFLDPDLVLIAEWNGKACGFIVFLPDVNQALWRFKSRYLPWRWFGFLRDIHRLRQGRLLILGVDPEYSGYSIAALMSQHLKKLLKERSYERIELSLVDSDNRKMRKVIESFDTRICQVYRLYKKDL